MKTNIVNYHVNRLLQELAAPPHFPTLPPLLRLQEVEKAAAPFRLRGHEPAIFHLVARKKTSAEIANLLGLKPSLVQSHIYRVMKKLNLNRRSQAVAELIRLGELEEVTPGCSLRGHERSIFNLLAQRKTSLEIAAALQMRPTRVQSHIYRVMKRLNVKRRSHAVAELIRLGELHAPQPGPPIKGRSREIFALLSQGNTVRDVSEELGIRTSAVYYHIKTVIEKLKVADAPAAIEELVRLGELQEHKAPSRLRGWKKPIFDLVAQKKTTWEIAEALGLKESRVQYHIHTVMRKLNVTSRVQAVAELVRLGELSPPPSPPLRFKGNSRRIFELLAQNRSKAEIAQELAIKESTVQYHVGKVMRKINVRNRGQAIAELVRLGELEAPQPTPATQLSGHRRRIFELLAQEKHPEEIVAELGIQERQVRYRINTVLETLDVENHSQAITELTRLKEL